MDNFTAEYFAGLQQIALQYLWTNYDYCYLDAMHEKNRREGANNIIAGCSHAMNGIVEKEISAKTINFSISSQDVYFDFLNIKKALAEGKNQIENCVINIGYYMLYQDLSLSKKVNYLVPGVYVPLFGDTHNYKGEKKYDLWKECRKFEDSYSMELLQQLCSEFARQYFTHEGSYYGTLKVREQNSLLPINGISWKEWKKEKKEVYAQKRVNDHNRLKKHTASRKENGKIIEEMVKYIYGNGIKPIFVIFPFTRVYNYYIDAEYKRDIFNLLDSLSFEVELLDMNDYIDLFGDEDFLDTDHLNLAGARKATKLLDEFIKEIG